MTTIPENVRDLLERPITAILTTIAPDGLPENTAIWVSYDGEYVLVNTADGRRKPNNIRNNPNVALFVIDPDDEYRWIDVRGVVEAMVPDINNENIDAHTRKYTEHDRYYGGFRPAEREGTEQRLVIKIKPVRVAVQS